MAVVSNLLGARRMAATMNEREREREERKREEREEEEVVRRFKLA
jgi:hypothetical protein